MSVAKTNVKRKNYLGSGLGVGVAAILVGFAIVLLLGMYLPRDLKIELKDNYTMLATEGEEVMIMDRVTSRCAIAETVTKIARAEGVIMGQRVSKNGEAEWFVLDAKTRTVTMFEHQRDMEQAVRDKLGTLEPVKYLSPREFGDAEGTKK
jgi:hypothetical protein